jgi:electron transfer flavoprotein alpha subunit
LIEKPTGAIPEKITPDVDDSLVKTRVRDVQKQEGKVLLTDAEIVVSGAGG